VTVDFVAHKFNEIQTPDIFKNTSEKSQLKYEEKLINDSKEKMKALHRFR